MRRENPIVAVLREIAAGERRVALTPPDVHRLAARKPVLIERDAGIEAGYTNEDYVAAGAILSNRAHLIEQADVLLAVRTPKDAERAKSDSLLISLGSNDDAPTARLRSLGIHHLVLDRIPRAIRTLSMDVQRSQAAIAGYAAALEGARLANVLLPMLTTPSGGLRPAKMIAVGAGVAGLHAIATSKRLGAVVHAFDILESTREQVESLGARFLSPGVHLEKEGAQDREPAERSEASRAAIRRLLAPIVAKMDIVVTSAREPDGHTPLLIDDETLAGMRRGAVIVDMTAPSGANTSRTVPDETVTEHGVRIHGPTNLPSMMPMDASRLCRFSDHQSDPVPSAYAADGRDECDFWHFAGRLVGARGIR